jgi:hypothetical protein
MVVIAVGLALSLVSGAAARERPRYDVPRGYDKCPSVTAWNGFFKWVSVRAHDVSPGAGLPSGLRHHG